MNNHFSNNIYSNRLMLFLEGHENDPEMTQLVSSCYYILNSVTQITIVNFSLATLNLDVNNPELHKITNYAVNDISRVILNDVINKNPQNLERLNAMHEEFRKEKLSLLNQILNHSNKFSKAMVDNAEQRLIEIIDPNNGLQNLTMK
jgi:hypothetical protein